MDMPAAPIARFLELAIEAIGPENVLTEDTDKAGYVTELRKFYNGSSPAVLRPKSTAEVSSLLELANGMGIEVVPQGGNTGLVGGQVPDASDTQVVLSLSRLNRIRDVDPAGNTMVVEAGCVLENIHKAAEEHDRLFPLTLGSKGSCQIGGNLSTNAGGTAVLAYGNTRDLVLGLEVVLADGRIWNGLRRLRKDNTGYDLKNLFVGAEGTLGIITAAVIKLFPMPLARQVGFLGIQSPHEAATLFNMLKAEFGNGVTGFEIIPRFGMDIVLKHEEGTRDPLETSCPWYILVEISGGSDDDGAKLQAVLEKAFADDLVLDGTVAQSETQAEDFWRIRHGLSESQRRDGGSVTHDVSVPVAKVPEFLDEAISAVRTIVPDCRPITYGHFGDGNIHFNISPSYESDRDAFFAKRSEIGKLVYATVRAMGGSVSAEHGIGQQKRDLLRSVKDPIELDMMRAIKTTLDPKGILNPGKVL